MNTKSTIEEGNFIILGEEKHELREGGGVKGKSLIEVGEE